MKTNITKYLKIGAFVAISICVGLFAAVKENVKVASLDQVRNAALCEVNRAHEQCGKWKTVALAIEWNWNGEQMRADAR
ncbi:hypothetical protein D3C84_953720 [compost metagenome]